MTEITRIDASDLSAAMAAGQLSSADVMTAFLDRIEAVNPLVNAIVSLRDRSELLTEAAAADQTERKSQIHGLPIAVKDLQATIDLRTTQGSPIFANFVPSRDDLLPARLRAAGAIIVGKTNTPEMGLGSHTFNPVHGATRNPYDSSRSAGGSSGGAAVAVATGMLPLADGSDMMGSLRNPAGWNNIYGFRPTWGLVPDTPTGNLFDLQLSTDGPMARSPRDIALLLQVLAGPDRLQPNPAQSRIDPNKLQVDLKARRIGWLGDWGGAWPFESGVLAQCETALAAFADLGVTVEPVAPPFPSEKLWQAWITLRSWDVAANKAHLYADAAKRAQMKPAMIWEIERGLALSAAEVHTANAIRSDWFRAAARLTETYDALALPSAQVWPFPVDWVHPTEIAGRKMDTYHRWMECVIPVSLLGLPCLNIPAGFGAEGLPMGIQLFGFRGQDQRLLELGQGYHTATMWPQSCPALRDS